MTHWGSVAGTPTWTPDGRIVAFTLKDFPPAAAEDDPPPPSELYAIAPDGSGEVRLTNDQTIQTDPDVSPADGTLAFTQWQAVAGEPGVFDLGIGALAAGGAASTLAPYSAHARRLQPELVARRAPDRLRGRLGDAPRERDARRRPPVGPRGDGRRRHAACARSRARARSRRRRSGRRTGRRIAFASDRHVRRGPRERNGRDFELYVMHADGTHVRRLTRNRVPDLYPNWQAVR